MAAMEGNSILSCPDWENTSAQDIIDIASTIDTSILGWDASLIDIVVDGLNKKLTELAMTPLYAVIKSWWAKQTTTSSNWSVIAPWMTPANTTAPMKLVSLRRIAVAMLKATDPQQTTINNISRLDNAQKALQLSLANLESTVTTHFEQQQQQMVEMLAKVSEIAHKDPTPALTPTPAPAANNNTGGGSDGSGANNSTASSAQLGETIERAAKRQKMYDEFGANPTTQTETSGRLFMDPQGTKLALSLECVNMSAVYFGLYAKGDKQLTVESSAFETDTVVREDERLNQRLSLFQFQQAYDAYLQVIDSEPKLKLFAIELRGHKLIVEQLWNDNRSVAWKYDGQVRKRAAGLAHCSPPQFLHIAVRDERLISQLTTEDLNKRIASLNSPGKNRDKKPGDDRKVYRQKNDEGGEAPDDNKPRGKEAPTDTDITRLEAKNAICHFAGKCRNKKYKGYCRFGKHGKSG